MSFIASVCAGGWLDGVGLEKRLKLKEKLEAEMVKQAYWCSIRELFHERAIDHTTGIQKDCWTMALINLGIISTDSAMWAATR